MSTYTYIKNGYVMIYMPKHHRAEKNGLVYEHVYLAEKYIGRQLEDKEVVHHEDRDRSNNSKNNLFVFKTSGDHNRYHATGVMIPTGDGAYTSPIRESICEYCSSVYKVDSNTRRFCSQKCFNMSDRIVERPSKDMLRELIFKKPFTHIGEMFGVSDNAVRKWCKLYGLPHRKKDIKKMLTDT